MFITDIITTKKDPALSEERIKSMTVENEIINYFHHLAECSNPSLQIGHFPSQIKKILKEWNVLSLSMGQLWILKENEKQGDEKRIEDLKNFIDAKEKELRCFCYREEILGK